MNCNYCGKHSESVRGKKRHCSVMCRFLDKTKHIEHGDGCSLWPYSFNKVTGYGQISECENGNVRLLTTHRLSYIHAFGEIPEGMFVCHRCDIRLCFNPKHLFAGTHQENINDMMQKGRYTKIRNLPTGDNHHFSRAKGGVREGDNATRAKITSAIAVKINELLLSGMRPPEIARQLSVSKGTVYQIKYGKAWRTALRKHGSHILG